MLAGHTRHEIVNLGNWVHTPEFHFSLKFVYDRLSVPFVILTFLLCGVIGGFATRYLHREPGFNRFFVFFAVFVLGMVVTSLAGTIETLFAGWELVGVSSALLVAFFQERLAPVRNGLRVWTVYRVSDAALLIAAVALHHLRGEGDFDALMGRGFWPAGEASLTAQQALIVGLLLLVAAAASQHSCHFLPAAAGDGRLTPSSRPLRALSVHLAVPVQPSACCSKLRCCSPEWCALSSGDRSFRSATRAQTDTQPSFASR
jgi:NAD(P)H-quinone oxidoreductase subunit 5